MPLNGCELHGFYGIILAFLTVSNLLTILAKFFLPMCILLVSVLIKFCHRKASAHVLSTLRYLSFHGYQAFLVPFDLGNLICLRKVMAL